jgi:hypothetical protein
MGSIIDLQFLFKDLKIQIQVLNFSKTVFEFKYKRD